MASPFSHTVRVRYGETDRMGVVYHGEYLAWMDEARTELMRSIGIPYDQLERDGVGLVVRRAQLRYRAPAKFGDDVTVRTSVDRLRGASVAFSYRIEHATSGEHLADGFTELAAVTFGTDPVKPRAIPDELRDALEEYVGQ